jgi:glycosyltransferase involved in cell wall biosynthesis
MGNVMRILFIYFAPHPIHEAFASTITDEFCECGRTFFAIITNVIKSILKSIYKGDKYDILFLESGTCLPLAISKKNSNTKIVLLNADPLFYELPKNNYIKRKIIYFLLSYVDIIIVNSDLNRKLALKHFDKEIYIVNPFGLNSNFEIECDIESKNLLFIANAGDYKGTNSLLDAVIMLNDHETNYDLYIVGSSGDEIESDFKWLHKEGFQKNNLDPYFKKCSLYVHPAEYESFGAVILEAMSAGLIPIITEGCGVSDVFKENELEILILENNKPDTIAKKITEISSKPVPWKKDISRKCREISSNYTEEKQLKIFKSTFDEITAKFQENEL